MCGRCSLETFSRYPFPRQRIVRLTSRPFARSPTLDTTSAITSHVSAAFMRESSEFFRRRKWSNKSAGFSPTTSIVQPRRRRKQCSSAAFLPASAVEHYPRLPKRIPPVSSVRNHVARNHCFRSKKEKLRDLLSRSTGTFSLI